MTHLAVFLYALCSQDSPLNSPTVSRRLRRSLRTAPTINKLARTLRSSVLACRCRRICLASRADREAASEWWRRFRLEFCLHPRGCPPNTHARNPSRRPASVRHNLKLGTCALRERAGRDHRGPAEFPPAGIPAAARGLPGVQKTCPACLADRDELCRQSL